MPTREGYPENAKSICNEWESDTTSRIYRLFASTWTHIRHISRQQMEFQCFNLASLVNDILAYSKLCISNNFWDRLQDVKVILRLLPLFWANKHVYLLRVQNRVVLRRNESRFGSRVVRNHHTPSFFHKTLPKKNPMMDYPREENISFFKHRLEYQSLFNIPLLKAIFGCNMELYTVGELTVKFSKKLFQLLQLRTR